MLKRFKTPKPRKGAWFVKTRGSYLPINGKGYLTYIPFIAYLLWPMFWLEGRGYPGALVVFLTVPQWVAAGVVMTWFASRKS